MHNRMGNHEELVERIEILSIELFNSHREQIGMVEQFQERFKPTLGWHYYLDLAWILKEITYSLPRGALILDAGAGCGILQFMLAELGYNVISADFVGRKFPKNILHRYETVIHALNCQEYSLDNRYTRHLTSVYGAGGNGIVSKIRRLLTVIKHRDPIQKIESLRFVPASPTQSRPFQGDVVKNCGRIFLYRCDIKTMPLLPDCFVDAVVSLSALEHNNHESFASSLDELLRVTKPCGKLVLTVSASQTDDWFHEPSKGWCYSDTTLKRLCRLSEDVPNNYVQKDALFCQLQRDGNELHKRLDPFYFQSGDNGMPWGKWEPTYQPVGIVKVKQ